MSNGIPNDIGFDVKRALKETKQALRAMTPEQQRQLLVKSGILTKSGSVAKPYAEVIQPTR